MFEQEMVASLAEMTAQEKAQESVPTMTMVASLE
jgi:hypothetical protein